MARQPRSRTAALAAAVVLPLALVACGGDSTPTASETTPSGTSGTSSSTTSSARPGGTTSSSPTGTGSTTSPAPDPEVSVTAAADEAQSAADRRAGTRAADGSERATRLSIPAVDLSTSLEPQGLREGKVNPPAGDVIWFTGHDRVRPGATGTSVIAGHVINQQGPDEFAALEQLETGDGVVVGYPGGEQLRFEVTSTDIVDKADLTTSADVWGENSDTRRIVLVTCDDELGFREDGHRTANFVAVAELPA